MSKPRSDTSTGPMLPKIQLWLGLVIGFEKKKFHQKILFFLWSKFIFRKIYFGNVSKIFFGKSKFSLKMHIKFLKNVRKNQNSPDFFRIFSKISIFIFNEKNWKFRFSEKIFKKKIKIKILKNTFRSQKIIFFDEIFLIKNRMTRPSYSCIFGSIGPVEVSERGFDIVPFFLCFWKKTLDFMTCPPEPHHVVPLKSKFWTKSQNKTIVPLILWPPPPAAVVPLFLCSFELQPHQP